MGEDLSVKTFARIDRIWHYIAVEKTIFAKL